MGAVAPLRGERTPIMSMSSSSTRPAIAGAGAPSIDVLVVVNPIAANTESSDVRTQVAAALESRGLRARVLETAKGPDTAAAVAHSVSLALNDGCQRVVAVGGDGTVSLVAAALMKHADDGPRCVLAIVPTGTANVLARELGIPLALESAIALALDGQDSMELDAIQTGDRPVFTQVGVGLDARMIRQTTREAQIRSGRRAYLAALVREAIGQSAHAFELEIDGAILRVKAWQIIVANIGVMGAPPFTWGPGIDPSDGALDICIYSARTKRDYLKLLHRLLTGSHQTDSNTQYVRVEQRVVIRSRRPVLVQGDGEILGRTPITLGVVPGALRVCVPRNVEDIEPMRGSPDDPVPMTGEDAPLAGKAREESVAEAVETIHRDVDTMVAQHSRTWVLQGWLAHPYTFFSALDAALYMRINAMKLGSATDRFLVAFSRVMHYGEGWAFVALVMLVADHRTAWKLILEALPVLWLTMLTVNYPLKRIFRRRRPFIAFVDARVLGPKPKDFSFPSGHTAAAFAGALLFGAHAPLWSPIFYGIAVVVGFSRIYLGVHYPSDVVIGGIVGGLIAGAFLALLRLVVAIA